MSAPAKRVLLIDDHEMSRRGLQAMLSTTDLVEVVGEAGDCEAGLAQVTALRPDIVLLDIRMPGVDGLACLGEIKKLDDPVAVVIVTAHDDRRYVLDAVRRGAAGYLLKEAIDGRGPDDDRGGRRAASWPSVRTCSARR